MESPDYVAAAYQRRGAPAIARHRRICLRFIAVFAQPHDKTR